MNENIVIALITCFPGILASIASIITASHNRATIKQSNATAEALVSSAALAAKMVLEVANTAAQRKLK